MTELTAPTQSITTQELPLEPVRLEAIDGPGRGACATLDRGTLVAGSSSRADLKLDDPSVSRQHASFELMRGAVRVRDLGSRNGLVFLGAKVDSARLPIGTSLTLGRTVVRIAPMKEERLSAHTELAGVVAQSPSMRRLLWRVERVAATDAAVIIRGPTGAGKEVVARAIHQLSARRDFPLEVFDCAAARGELLESDLFGHVRGAFTGAVSDRAGVVERADRGTLLLDNVDQLPLELQPRLLRLLEEKQVRRVGGSKPLPVNVRVLATMQGAPEALVAEGHLRSDVFYRLAEVILEVPPLAARREDIAALAARFAVELKGVSVALSPVTVAALEAHPWPGNARELRNAIARCLAFGAVDDERPLESSPPPNVDLKAARTKVVSSFEADFVLALLRKHRWNVAAAAREAKVARSHLYTLISRHCLSRP